MDAIYCCPACDAKRNHPGAYCDGCDYSADPRTDADPVEAGAPSLCFGCSADTCTYPACNMGRKPAPRASLGNEAAGLLLSAALGVLLALWLVTDVRDVDRMIVQLPAQLAALATL